jgi:hypothetical protein
MGGPGAPDDLRLGHLTQERLVTSDDPRAVSTGGCRFHQRRREPPQAAADEQFQERLLAGLAELTGLRV